MNELGKYQGTKHERERDENHHRERIHKIKRVVICILYKWYEFETERVNNRVSERERMWECKMNKRCHSVI